MTAAVKKFSVLLVIYFLLKRMATHLGMVLWTILWRLRNCRFVENQSSVNYKSLVGSNEFTINNDGNWSEDIQFELQTSNWNDEKKFKIIVNGKTVVEKVWMTVFPVFLLFLSLVCTKCSSNIRETRFRNRNCYSWLQNCQSWRLSPGKYSTWRLWTD